jgi:hypothetical protein
MRPGRQPTSLTAEAATRHIEMPLEWRSQKTALNIQHPVTLEPLRRWFSWW